MGEAARDDGRASEEEWRLSEAAEFWGGSFPNYHGDNRWAQQVGGFGRVTLSVPQFLRIVKGDRAVPPHGAARVNGGKAPRLLILATDAERAVNKQSPS